MRQLAHEKNSELEKKLPKELITAVEGAAIGIGVYTLYCALCYVTEKICRCMPDNKTRIDYLYGY